ncbi:MAG: hypothetical protein D8M58_08245 [Calditrichaeota bacterium]|nr:MAG: hypothetical protein DWQ03_18245 [Calditrichota bacterium]MBL1205373.1 hypothetical protein [Calditrichota bacterium]NOG45202.1 hypothetical protein [Calditrichota bacterium]
MMKNIKLFLPLIIAIGLLVVIETVKPKPLNWTPTFSSTDKIPFGNYIVYSLLDDLFPGENLLMAEWPIYNTLPDSLNTIYKNYIFVCNDFEPDQLDTETLLSFVEEGGNVFISAHSFGTNFSDSLGISTNLKYVKDSLSVNRSLLNKIDKSFPIKHAGLSWHFDKIDSSKMKVLGIDEENATNFIKMGLGTGQLFLHTVPLAFTNYNILTPGNEKYISAMFSNLPKAPTIWDQYYIPARKQRTSSPISFVLNTETLRWAYYLTLVGILLFIFVEGKRKQRAIPTIKPLSNDTLSFVDVIGRLYYSQQNHTDVAIKSRTYLLEFIRHQYNMDTSKLDESFVTKLSVKTAIEFSELQNLFGMINKVNPTSEMTAESLASLNKEIEKFYKNCN